MSTQQFSFAHSLMKYLLISSQFPSTDLYPNWQCMVTFMDHTGVFELWVC